MLLNVFIYVDMVLVSDKITKFTVRVLFMQGFFNFPIMPIGQAQTAMIATQHQGAREMEKREKTEKATKTKKSDITRLWESKTTSVTQSNESRLG